MPALPYLSRPRWPTHVHHAATGTHFPAARRCSAVPPSTRLPPSTRDTARRWFFFLPKKSVFSTKAQTRLLTISRPGPRCPPRCPQAGSAPPRTTCAPCQRRSGTSPSAACVHVCVGARVCACPRARLWACAQRPPSHACVHGRVPTPGHSMAGHAKLCSDHVGLAWHINGSANAVAWALHYGSRGHNVVHACSSHSTHWPGPGCACMLKPPPPSLCVHAPLCVHALHAREAVHASSLPPPLARSSGLTWHGKCNAVCSCSNPCMHAPDIPPPFLCMYALSCACTSSHSATHSFSRSEVAMYL